MYTHTYTYISLYRISTRFICNISFISRLALRENSDIVLRLIFREILLLNIHTREILFSNIIFNIYVEDTLYDEIYKYLKFNYVFLISPGFL